MLRIPLYVSAAGIVALISLGFAACVIAVGRTSDRAYLRSWRWAWIALGLHALFSALALIGVTAAPLIPLRPYLSVLSLLAAWTHLYFLHEGMWQLCLPGQRLPPWRRLLPAVALVVAIGLVFGPIAPGPEGAMVRYILRVTVLSVTWGIAYVLTGVLIVRNAPTLSALGRRTLAGALILYGLMRLTEPLTFDMPRSPVLEQFLIFGGVPFLVAMGAGMLITLLDAERRELLEAAELRARAERTVSETEARFRSLIENSSDIIFMVGRDGTIHYVSPSVTRVLGHAPEAIVGTNAFDQMHRDDVPALRDALLRSFDGDSTVPSVVPFRARTADGDFARLEAVSRPFAEADGTTRLIVSARDVRERLRLETELLSARRLETVGRLAGGVAHDFNNLLTAILGNVALMRGATTNGTELRADLEEIEQSALRGAELTRRLLAFARRQMIEPRVLDLGTQVAGLEKLLVRLLGEDARLSLEADPQLWFVKADPTAVEQALVNLVVNARDAMPGGGTLLIRASNVSFDDAGHEALGVPAGEWVRVDVIDSGIGIDESTLGHIFEPFFTTKGTAGGTGLGLATVFGIVSQAGGYVRVASTPGVGSTFSLFFPRVTGEQVTASDPLDTDESVHPRARSDETLLLIEDEDSVRQVTGRLLRGLGYRVLTAVDGADGISIAAGHGGEIQGVVSDLVMPHVGGAEAVARIRQQRPDVRVVFISGFSEEALSWRGAMPQGGRLLTKPFSLSDLARSVRGALDA